jgi:hypothetical protein
MEKITKDNFLERIKDIDPKDLPFDIKELYDFVMMATERGTNWNAYSAENSKIVFDTFFKRINDYLGDQEKPSSKVERAKIEPAEKVHKEVPLTIKQKQAERNQKSRKVKVEQEGEDFDDFSLVERIPEEIKLMRRYLSFNGKRKTKEDFLRFINALQRAIVEKKIRKGSRYEKQMNYIQENLVKTYNSMGKSIPVQIRDNIVAQFKELINSEKVMPSVRLIKRYINLNGKYGVKDKAKTLITTMGKAVEKGVILKKDKYYDLFDRMHNNLSKYVKSKTQKILSIEKAELNGLNGILESCGCAMTMHGTEEQVESEPSCLKPSTEQTSKANTGIVNSMDFLKMRFETLGFRGKYLNFIGDPSRGFRAMVYGKPKMGKSYLCADFAGYLARHHGKVLYVAKEEGLDHTLQEKLKAKEVAHPNLDVTDDIPQDLSGYDFIFFDSVNKLGLSPEDLQTLEENNPGKSFIYVFQTTKDGNVRGTNEFMHNVDIVIEVYEVGKASQRGRFNQGGELNIFDNDLQQAAGLEGRKPANKPAKGSIHDWADTKYLQQYDIPRLERIKGLFDAGEMEVAMDVAMNSDTEIRDAVPPDAWLKMGGLLTSTGKEKLRKLQNNEDWKSK